ncbi:THAP domain-containing protein 5-like isoform X1 [Scomber scombrus]|uniref:THAP domain-containing protein 5-like isoform X1 n=1 Tax=Scomber scombrus TaxID=13677 RepID=A0AAV1Q817_SCOSC
MSCSAFGCTRRPAKDSTAQFFRFPLSDEIRVKKWVMNVRRRNWMPSRSSRLCCAHFEENQFFLDIKGKRRLKDTAVPTIFNFPPYLVRKKEATKATRIKSVSMTVSDGFAPAPVPLCSPPSYQPHWELGPVSPPPPSPPAAPLCPVFNNEFVPKTESEDIKISPADFNMVTVKEEPVEEPVEEPSEEPVEEPIHYNIVVITADFGQVVADDTTESSTSQDSQAVSHDHSYLCTKEKQLPACNDHCYIGSESPRTLKRKVLAVQEQLIAARKKLKVKCQQTRRLKSRLLTLKDLVKVLRKKLQQKNQQQL